MSLLRSRQAFGPSCPSGGTWYSCGFGSRFLGCCGSEACENGCPDGNLEPASFNIAYYGQFPDQECSDGSWYTCNATTPPFLGCCKSNPCQLGSCPNSDLTAAFLSNDPGTAASFSPSGGPASTSTSSSTQSTSSSLPPTASPVLTQPISHPNQFPVRAVVGGIIGGISLIIGIIAICIYCRKRSRGPSREYLAPEQPPKSSIVELSPDTLRKSSPPPPKYSREPSSAPDPIELPGSPVNHHRIIQHPDAIAPAELDASQNPGADQRVRWTHDTMQTEVSQPSGLGINHAFGSTRFSSQSAVSALAAEKDTPSLRTGNRSASETSQPSPILNNSPPMHQMQRIANPAFSTSFWSRQY